MKKRRELTKAEEITNAIIHGIGLGLAIAALIILIILATIYGDPWYIVGFSIYGSTLVILYLASTLYHSFPRGKSKEILRIVDHSSIFLLIAGTYTPIILTSLRGTLGWTIFAIVWGIAFAGIILKFIWINKFKILSTILYLLMGWLVIIAIKPLIAALNDISLIFLIMGGLFYTIGVIFFAWRSLKYSHAIWHLFVLAGSICHFFTILYLLPR